MSEKKINLEEARKAFEAAATEHSQEFELFFLSKLYGLSYSYTDKTCEITFEPKGFSFNSENNKLWYNFDTFKMTLQNAGLLN